MPPAPVPAPAVGPAVHPGDLQPRTRLDRVLVGIFVVLPLLAVFAAVPMAWSAGLLGWSDVVIGLVMYLVSGLGVTVGFHRYLTHGSFNATRPLKIALAAAGSLSLEMSAVDWVATDRRHHKFSDLDGDPHSPWRFGTGWRALARGLVYSHVGWLFDRETTNRDRYAPDLLRDPDLVALHRAFPWLVFGSLVGPAVAGGLLTWSFTGALTAFFWASLVRVALLHHVTWSINSICHVFGADPFTTRDHSRNVWWLAVPSFGESWHNLHHAEPTSARHGVLRGQLDPSARVIRWFELLGWAYDVRWPTEQRLAAKRAVA